MSLVVVIPDVLHWICAPVGLMTVLVLVSVFLMVLAMGMPPALPPALAPGGIPLGIPLGIPPGAPTPPGPLLVGQAAALAEDEALDEALSEAALSPDEQEARPNPTAMVAATSALTFHRPVPAFRFATAFSPSMLLLLVMVPLAGERRRRRLPDASRTWCAVDSDRSGRAGTGRTLGIRGEPAGRAPMRRQAGGGAGRDPVRPNGEGPVSSAGIRVRGMSSWECRRSRPYRPPCLDTSRAPAPQGAPNPPMVTHSYPYCHPAYSYADAA